MRIATMMTTKESLRRSGLASRFNIAVCEIRHISQCDVETWQTGMARLSSARLGSDASYSAVMLRPKVLQTWLLMATENKQDIFPEAQIWQRAFCPHNVSV